jgi:chromosome segregation ATPase
LDGQVSDLDKQKKDLRKRLTRLHKEHEELSHEFTSFRREKEDQENFRNNQFKSLEDKISHQQQQDLEKINNLKKYNEDLENEKEVIKKENNILILR